MTDEEERGVDRRKQSFYLHEGVLDAAPTVRRREADVRTGGAKPTRTPHRNA
jgi:hypothetical protein